MKKDTRRGWLAELTAGSPVIIDFINGRPEVTKVDNITPTGRIKVGGYVFAPDGEIYSKYTGSRPILVRCTQEAQGAIAESALRAEQKSKLLKELRNVSFSRLSLEQLKEIKEIVEGC